MWTCRQSLDPLLDALEGVLVGQVEAVDDAHHAAEEQLAQGLVLVLAGCVPVQKKMSTRLEPQLGNTLVQSSNRLGCGSGIMVSFLAFCSDDPSSILACCYVSH